MCRRGDSESLLLLCDGCDKGTHTYCCVPPLDAIPDGDWYCHHCAQVSPIGVRDGGGGGRGREGMARKDKRALVFLIVTKLLHQY